MHDLISRQAAIDAVINADYKDCGVLVERRCRKFEEALRSLPTAQAEIIRCKDCKHWNNVSAADGLNSCEMDALIRHESFFCANGERKDGEQG